MKVVLELEPLEARRVSDEVTAHILSALAESKLESGDCLPSERDLAEQLGASRASVRESIRVLEAMGVVNSAPQGRNGRHTAVISSKPASNALTRLLYTHIQLGQIDNEDLLDLRESLECRGIYMLSRRRTAHTSQVVKLQELVARMHETTTKDQYANLDEEFHQTIVELTQNRLITAIITPLQTVVRQQMLANSSKIEDWKDGQARLTAEHSSIIQSATAGDVWAACEAIRHHIWYWTPLRRRTMTTSHLRSPDEGIGTSSEE